VSAGVVGMLLGLMAAVGFVLVLTFAPPFRSVRLVDRLVPTCTTPHRRPGCWGRRPRRDC
jgi:hypothetical protein